MPAMTAWCDDCGRETNRYPKGGCRACAIRRMHADSTPEWRRARAEAVRAGMLTKMTPEERREKARAGGRAAVAKHGSALARIPHEERSARSRAFLMSMTPEERFEWARRGSLAAQANMITDPRWDDETYMGAWSKVPVEELQRVADYAWIAENVPFEVRCGLVEAEGMAA